MISLLAAWFIPARNDVSNPEVRRAYGVLCGAVGIFLNLLLFLGKFFAGLLTHSIAMTADAFNNLSDAGSSLVTLFGFRLAGQKPDPDHPFGHGRAEYLSGLIVSLLILLMGFELLKSSVGKILSPAPITFNTTAITILAVSIAVKFYMFLYNRNVGKKISSAAMRATGLDSLSDMIATLVVLACAIVSHLTALNLDGWCGVLVSLFIFYAGIRAAKETVDPLLGKAPDPELVKQIGELVMSNEVVIGMHDLIIHDYGPGRMMLSLHVEVPANQDFATVHDLIDNIEHELSEKLSCEATIHMDPVATDDAFTVELKRKIELLVSAVEPGLTIHDFRAVTGPTHTNLIFDVVVPFRCPHPDCEIKSRIETAVQALDPTYFTVIKIDKPYL
ncbi:MAG: cation transporter [Ruminococcaceae bacterium]|nr:cation transporter [Oscillospiraceae bacterium]